LYEKSFICKPSNNEVVAMSKTLALVLVLVFLTASSIIVALPVSGATVENTWVTKASMPSSAYGSKAAVANGKIFAIGGFSSSNNEYDPATDSWNARTPMPNSTSFSAVAYQNKIYCVGGSATYVYDPSTDTWKNRAAMPASITGLANVVDGNIYVISGYASTQKQLSNLNEVYNISNDSWTTKKPISYPVSAYASTVCGGKLYIMGGQGISAQNVDFTQIYDPATDTWSSGTPMPSKVEVSVAGATAGIMAPERIYLFGGFTSGTNYHTTNLTQIYNPENDTWTYGAPMLSPRTDFAVVNVNDQLYILGGSNVGLGAPFILTNEQYTPIGYGAISQTSPTPTPTVPEFPLWTIPLLLTIMLATAGLLVYHKKHKPNLVKEV
jgi:N-acetylneuraminic acid mutarotase